MDNKKGQGALEYLLLIGGAIVVAVIVVTLLLGVGSSGSPPAELGAATALCRQVNATAGTAVGADCTGSVCINGFEWDCSGIVGGQIPYPNCVPDKTTSAC